MLFPLLNPSYLYGEALCLTYLPDGQNIASGFDRVQIERWAWKPLSKNILDMLQQRYPKNDFSEVTQELMGKW